MNRAITAKLNERLLKLEHDVEQLQKRVESLETQARAESELTALFAEKLANNNQELQKTLSRIEKHVDEMLEDTPSDAQNAPSNATSQETAQDHD